MARTLALEAGVDDAYARTRARRIRTSAAARCSAGTVSSAPRCRCRTRPKKDRGGAFSSGRAIIARPSRPSQALGLELLGFYHSHPDHPARPSQYDLDHAWPSFSYVIVSVMAGEPADMRSWTPERRPVGLRRGSPRRLNVLVNA